jgi:hypothetical protein
MNRPFIAGSLLAFIAVPACRRDVTDSAKGVTVYSVSLTSTASTASPLLSLGQNATLPSERVRFVSQQRCASPEPSVPGNHNSLWAAELEITNTSAKPIAINPYYLTFKDSQNYTYVTSLVGCPPILDARFLRPGERARGFVPFELPQALQEGTLTYRPITANNPADVATFHVEF